MSCGGTVRVNANGLCCYLTAPAKRRCSEIKGVLGAKGCTQPSSDAIRAFLIDGPSLPMRNPMAQNSVCYDRGGWIIACLHRGNRRVCWRWRERLSARRAHKTAVWRLWQSDDGYDPGFKVFAVRFRQKVEGKTEGRSDSAPIAVALRTCLEAVWTGVSSVRSF